METPAIVVGVPHEHAAGETRVALTPDAVERLAAAGSACSSSARPACSAGFDDEAYRGAGAEIAHDAASLYARAGMIARVAPPGRGRARAAAQRHRRARAARAVRARRSRAGARRARRDGDRARAHAAHHARAVDGRALSSQATVAGYRAALLAAERLPRFFPLLMTAAGTVAPAKVLVLGAGVAGLQAIATARRLGAVVSAFDVRAAAREQVESLGATFVAIELPEGDGEGAGGYAKELSEEAAPPRAGARRAPRRRLGRRDHDGAHPGTAGARS